ncbi:hypothetical protein [Acinetobacter gyllenbergii]|uniref:hypothetical protein n=1 Tax=Acinetobacter gyllenbergii TaxID=134534 RepID=UPI00241F598A|nr:hypothetical protein [Acinetobacter gyllenbergii]
MRKLVKKRKKYQVKPTDSNNSNKFNQFEMIDTVPNKDGSKYDLPVHGQVAPFWRTIFQYLTLVFALFLLFIFISLALVFLDEIIDLGHLDMDQFIADQWIKLLLVAFITPLLILLFYSKPRAAQKKAVKNYIINDDYIEFILLDNSKEYLEFDQVTNVTIIPARAGNYIFSVLYNCNNTGNHVKIYNLFEPDFTMLRIYPLKNKEFMLSVFLQQLREKNPSAHIDSLFSFLLCIDPETLMLDVDRLNREKRMNNIFWLAMAILVVGLLFLIFWYEN